MTFAGARTLGLAGCLVLGAADLVYLNARVAPSFARRLERRPTPAVTPIAVAIEAAPGPLDPPETSLSPPPAPAIEPIAIHFLTGRTALDAASQREIALQVARASEEALIVVEGHADRRGSELRNLRLSRRRADAVARRLRTAGVPTQRIVVRSFGSHRPAVEGMDPHALELNRRVEIIIERGRL
jgi:outer membrane protein OmpA-like peptidoglycan-associated protein